MRRDKLYIQDIEDACKAIGRFIADFDYKKFLKDEVLQSAILQKLIVIGEAAGRVSREYRTRHPEIEWEAIVAFRNIAVHEYFSVNWEIVWTTAVDDVPELLIKMRKSRRAT